MKKRPHDEIQNLRAPGFWGNVSDDELRVRLSLDGITVDPTSGDWLEFTYDAFCVRLTQVFSIKLKDLPAYKQLCRQDPPTTFRSVGDQLEWSAEAEWGKYL